jgi:hypothetical protein
MPASIALKLFAEAGVGLRGDLVGVKIIQVSASLSLALNAELGKDQPWADNNVGIHYANGDLRFHAKIDKTLQFNMGIALEAAIRAEILKIWSWERRWRLAESVAKTIDMSKWPMTARFKIKNESHGTLPMRTEGPALNAIIIPGETEVAPEIDEGKLDVNTMLTQLFDEADKKQGGRDQSVTPIGGKAGHVAPTGAEDNPIPMIWYKPLWWYLDPVKLNINGKKRDFKRDSKAKLPHGPEIGVSYWPGKGDVVQLRDPTKRGGKAQGDFNKALSMYGFKTAGWNADHVVDVNMGGADNFSNLWLLEAGVNQRAGNWQLGQSVRFSKDDEKPGNVYGPIAIQGQEYLRGRYFVIRDVRDPPA